MRKILGLLIVFGTVATPCLAQKVTIDYAHDFDFSTIKTFAYQDTKETNVKNQLMDDRIRDGIIKRLTDAGLQQVDSDPDMFVTYHITTKQDAVFNTMGFGYGGWGAGWGAYGGMGGSTTTETTYTEGTLIIDAYDKTDKNLVWRGTGTVVVKEKPEKQEKQIDKILDKLATKWQSIHAADKGK
jgi:hypothetical protein